MKGRFLKGMAAGTLIGAAAGMLLTPGMDRRTRKKFMKAGRKVTGFTTDIWDGIRDMMK